VGWLLHNANVSIPVWCDWEPALLVF